MQIIWLDPALDEGAHQRGERRGIVIDAAQQDRLAHQWNTGICKPRTRRAGIGAQFAGMVGVDRDPGGRALDPQRRDHLGIDAPGIGDWNTGVDADDLHMMDPGKIGHDLGQPARRQHQRIAAGQDDFPDLRMGADVIQRRAVGVIGQGRGLSWSDHFAPETEPAIDRTDMNELEQDPVRIAMHDPGDWRMRIVADRVGVLTGLLHQLVSAWDELARNRIVGVGRIDQRDEFRCHCDRVARSDLFEFGQGCDRRETGIDQLVRLAQRRR